MALQTKVVEVRVLPTVEEMIIRIAVLHYGGNQSKYIRELIYADLIKRDFLEESAVQILKEAEA